MSKERVIRGNPFDALFRARGLEPPKTSSNFFGSFNIGIGERPCDPLAAEVVAPDDVGMPADKVQTKSSGGDVQRAASLDSAAMGEALAQPDSQQIVSRGPDCCLQDPSILAVCGPRQTRRYSGRPYLKTSSLDPSMGVSSQAIAATNAILRGANQRAKHAGNLAAVMALILADYSDSTLELDPFSLGTKLMAMAILLKEGVRFRNGVVDPDFELVNMLEQVYESDGLSPTTRYIFGLRPEFPRDCVGLLAYALLPPRFYAAGGGVDTEAYYLHQGVHGGFTRLRFVLPNGFPAGAVRVGGEEVTYDKVMKLVNHVYSGRNAWMIPVCAARASSMVYLTSFCFTGDNERAGHAAHNTAANGADVPFYVKPTGTPCGLDGNAFLPGDPYDSTTAAEAAKVGSFPAPWSSVAFKQAMSTMPRGAGNNVASIGDFNDVRLEQGGIWAALPSGPVWLGRADGVNGVLLGLRALNAGLAQQEPGARTIADVTDADALYLPSDYVLMVQPGTHNREIVENLSEFFRAPPFQAFVAKYLCEPTEEWHDALQPALPAQGYDAQHAWKIPVMKSGGMAFDVNGADTSQPAMVPQLDYMSVAVMLAGAAGMSPSVFLRPVQEDKLAARSRRLFLMSSWTLQVALFSRGLEPGLFGRISLSPERILAGVDPQLIHALARYPADLEGRHYSDATTRLYTFGCTRFGMDKEFMGSRVKRSVVDDGTNALTASLSSIDSSWVDAAIRNSLADGYGVQLDVPSGRRWSVVWIPGRQANQALPLPITVPRVRVRDLDGGGNYLQYVSQVSLKGDVHRFDVKGN